MADLIDRQAAIDALMEKDKKLRNLNWYDKPYAKDECAGIDEAMSIISNLLPAQPDLSDYSDKLWREAYERGKAEAQPKPGSRLDDAISNVAYILDSLMAYRNISETGDCNTCKVSSMCRYAPKPGQLVRYNCPFYEPTKEGKG